MSPQRLPERLPLWHVREDRLALGTVIGPGRWGQIVTAGGQQHPFFFREQLLELYRLSQTDVPISRLACSFAFEDRSVAEEWAREDALVIHSVVPTDAEEAGVRLDMLWITWLGEPGSTFQGNLTRCRAYRAGQSTSDVNPMAHPCWEWLFDGGLRVVGY